MSNRFEIVVDYVSLESGKYYTDVMETISGMSHLDRLDSLETELNNYGKTNMIVTGYSPADSDMVVEWKENFWQASDGNPSDGIRGLSANF
tara:strand:- start:66 stop:338 length:273 start_codon:yes stop_codon:yes gene_type:complete